MRTLIVAVVATLIASPAAAQGRPHLQVLSDIPESQLFLVMNAVATSLGVGCEHCHMRNAPNPNSVVGGWLWDRDDKPAKAKGREMMRMVRELNASRYEGRPVVTCFTCHRGDTRVVNVPPLPPHWGSSRTPVTLPAARDVVAKYIAAVGGAGVSTRFATLVMEGRDDRPGGRYEADERHGEVRITMTRGDRFRLDLHVPPDPATSQAMDGSIGWVARDGVPRALAAADVARVRRIATRYAPLKVVEPVENLRVDRLESIRGRDTYALQAVVDSNTTRTYFFEIATGLLIRELTTTATPLVPLQEQVEYDDYRSVDGVMLPFVVRSADDAPYDNSTKTFTTIRRDVPVDDALFAMPQPKPGP